MGGLVGVGAKAFLAPQSGKETRGRTRQEGLELHDLTAETIEGVVAQARGKARRITASVRKQAEEPPQRGQKSLDWQRERLSAAVEAGGTAVHTISNG